MSENLPLMVLTVTGASGLIPVAFHAEEAISAPYSVTVDVVTQTRIDTTSVLFQPACLTVQRSGLSRYFHGMVRAVTVTGKPLRGYFRYQFAIVPRLWFLNQTIDCRIFQAKSVGDIITTICGEGSQTLTLRIYGSQTPLPYVTQYNESKLRFISRLMEQAGYYYFFDHSNSDHTLIVTDQTQAFPASPKPLMYVIHEGDNSDVFSEWRALPATALGSMTLLDYDPTQTALLQNQKNTRLTAAGTSARSGMRWPALAFDTPTVTGRATIDMEAAEAEVSLCEAEGSNVTFAPGSQFTLETDPITSAGLTVYMVRAVNHNGSDDTWATGAAKVHYENMLSVFPATVQWRQKITIPRPVMAGIYAATVIGPAGSEIYGDDLARVKARLMWDHRQDTDPNQAIWMRVITPMAGNSWGMQHMPRIGTEVAVAFMDGDPDRPVVVGGFYNASMAPIFPVPAQQNKSGFRSRSTQQGGTANFSEFSFDDTKSSELVFLHAEKDMSREVENNDSLTVGNAQTITIAKGRTVTVTDKGDSLTVKGGDHTITVSQGDQSTTISQGNQSNTVSQGNFSETISKGNHSTTVSTGNHSTTVSQGNLSTTVSMGNHGTTVSMGNLSMTVSMGAVTIEAMQSITLKVGGNSVTISPTGVTIKGIMVDIEGQAMLTAKAPMAQVSGDGMLIVKGGIVMIN